MQDYSVKNFSPKLILEIKKALSSVEDYGSLEVYIQKGVVTQITVRNIKKTSHMDGQNAN